MDIRYFLNLLWKRKWLLLVVVAAAGTAAFFLIGKMPETYKANAIVSTGIIEYKGVNIEKENPFIQQFQVENAFSNLIEAILNRSTVRIITKRLLRHDFATDGATTPFRDFPPDEEKPDREDLQHLIRLIAEEEPLVITGSREDQERNRVFDSMAKKLEYDYESIRKNISVKRIGETDYINIEFKSENPRLSFFVVDAFCEVIIDLDRSVQTQEESSAVNFYRSLAEEKKDYLDTLTKEFNYYKAHNNVVNLEEQTKSIVSQIRDLEILREQFNKNIPSLETNIDNLNLYIKQSARVNADNYAQSVFQNEDVIEISEQLKEATDQYYATGMNDKNLRNKMDDLQERKNELLKKKAIHRRNDEGDGARRNADLLDKRIETELELNTAKESVKSLDKAIGRLRSKQNSLVSDEAYLGNLEQQIQISEKEYFDIVNKLQQAEQVSKKPGNRLTIIEPAQMPDKPEPSQKGMLALFSGASAGILATVFLFVMAFFDNRLSSPYKFRNYTKLSLIGTVPKLKSKNFDFSALFLDQSGARTAEYFRESLRKIRYSVETSGASVLLVTSLKPGEGKSLFGLALAYSLSLTNRKVLIIDTNFRNNALSPLANASLEEIPFSVPQVTRTGGIPVAKSGLPQNITITGNAGGEISPTEALKGNDFVKILYDLSFKYDYIIMEGPSLNQYSDSRELALYAQKVIAVFSAESKIGEQDRESIDYLKNLKDKFLGAVLNKYVPGKT